MTDTELLAKIKDTLHITGDYQDETILNLMYEVKGFMADCGVNVDVINSAVSVGVIMRGISDLWNYGNGNTVFSEYFYQRVLQLKYREPDPTLTILTVKSVQGGTVGTTKISITGKIGNKENLYKIQSSQIDLPTYGEDLSTWTKWDGVSDIPAENRHYICVAEVDDNFKALSAGVTRVVVNLG